MTSDERFQQIESTLQATAAILKSSTESQGAATAALLKAQAHTQETIADMAASIGKYVDAAEARTKRIEENLDALNGKSKH